MGLPNIAITFKTAAAAAVQRSRKGTVALILRDANTAAAGAHSMTDITGIPAALGEDNRAYITRTFLGYQNPPRMVLAYVLGTDGALTDALTHFAAHSADYLCGPANCTPEEAAEIAAWVKARRAGNSIIKAVLPKLAADCDGVVNVTVEETKVAGATLTPAQLCSRIAGLIAGTPMTISCTYAPLPEVLDVKRLTKDELDAAIDKGEFTLWHDGEKVKVARGVNSFVTTTKDKGATFRKIKVVEAVDMMRSDIRRTAEDSYIGKYANSYDNKCLLISAVKGYLDTLEQEGILQRGSSEIGIDIAAQRTYLLGTGIDVDKLSEQEIKEADTGDKVFLTGRTKVLDAIEDIALTVMM